MTDQWSWVFRVIASTISAESKSNETVRWFKHVIKKEFVIWYKKNIHCLFSHFSFMFQLSIWKLDFKFGYLQLFFIKIWIHHHLDNTSIKYEINIFLVNIGKLKHNIMWRLDCQFNFYNTNQSVCSKRNFENLWSPTALSVPIITYKSVW